MWKGCKAEAKPRKQHHYQVSVPPQQGSPDTSPTKAFPFKKKKRYRFPPNNGSSDVSTGGILHIAYRLEGKGSQSMIKTNPSVPTS